ncbi:hypothetical protein TRFO_30348 [Tritrichomonas foetus]|uniref:Uncharacterized protein n=1 Tax=Tritrichomonas foetus TaxID=1144522 RepID=A0A1J4JUX8_9EUKA|nr:hypothetical protein TRFO_30348 [Tritrichomonas foetus]|eukprot:OHT02514.1 hypothetical protein TRFO_30348 [Tritrichomonas foetus]
MKKNIQEIINQCFSLDAEDGSKTFLLFNKAPTALLNALLIDDIFYTEVSKVFMQPQPPIIIVSRIASILLQIITSIPEQANDCVGFLYQLLPYLSEPGVFDALYSICIPTSQLAAAQNALIESNFPQYIINELNSTNDELLISAILRIIKYSCENKVLSESFRTNSIIHSLYTLTKSDYEKVANELWWAITNMVNSDTIHKMIIFIPKAFEIIREPYHEMHRFRIFAIEFIAEMLKYKSDGLSDFLNMQVQEVVLRLIVQFPDCSNLMGSVFRLIKHGLIWDFFADSLIEHFVPVMIFEASSQHRSAASARSMKLLKQISTRPKYKETHEKILAKIESYQDFCNNKLLRYKMIMKESYGGEMTKYQPSRSPSSFLLF